MGHDNLCLEHIPNYMLNKYSLVLWRSWNGDDHDHHKVVPRSPLLIVSLYQALVKRAQL